MHVPATKRVGKWEHAIAVWRAEDGSIRYTVTIGEQPAHEYRDARQGWEPFVLKLNSDGKAHAPAYMACRDADPIELYYDLEAALRRRYVEVSKPMPMQARRLFSGRVA